MPTLPETYASPNMRLGLLLTDCPGATVSFEAKRGTDLGIPESFGGDEDYCVATIHFPADDPRSDARGWKAMPARGDSEKWEVLCTKALGRALKRAGYPGDTDDLQLLVLWRKRNAEVDALGAGVPVGWAGQPAVGAGPDEVQQALAAASTVGTDDEYVDAEVVAEALDKEAVAEAIELIAGLSDEDAALFDGYLETLGVPTNPKEWSGRMTPAQLDDVFGWLEGPAD